MKRFAVLALVSLIAGCGSSPPTQHYTLDPVPAQRSATTIAGTPVKVVAVHIPASLDRQEIIRESADHKVDISDQNRWSAPLDEMIQRVLTEDLAQRLPGGMVVLPQEPAQGNVNSIVLDILQFDQAASGAVVFDGSWSLLQNASDKATVSRHLHLTARASGGYADQVGAMSRIVGDIADQIVAALPSGQKPIAALRAPPRH